LGRLLGRRDFREAAGTQVPNLDQATDHELIRLATKAYLLATADPCPLNDSSVVVLRARKYVVLRRLDDADVSKVVALYIVENGKLSRQKTSFS
jgi:hypothetical protein